MSHWTDIDIKEDNNKNKNNHKNKTTISEGFTKEELNSRRTILKYQHRMHPEISKLPREQFYKNDNALLDLEMPEMDGIDALGHISRRMTPRTIEKADMVLVMEQFHKDEIIRQCPYAENKIKLLKKMI